MATVREVIEDQLATYYVTLSDARIERLLVEAGLSGSDEYAAEQVIPVKQAFVKFIPELLLAPDITEAGFSIKRNLEGIKAYYSMLCGELGITPVTSDQPKIRSKSNYW